MVISPMVHALRALNGSRCVVKLRQKSAQPLEVGANNQVTFVEEHISIQCSRFRELNDSGVFIFTTDGAEIWVHAEDIFAVFSVNPGVMQ